MAQVAIFALMALVLLIRPQGPPQSLVAIQDPRALIEHQKPGPLIFGCLSQHNHKNIVSRRNRRKKRKLDLSQRGKCHSGKNNPTRQIRGD